MKKIFETKINPRFIKLFQEKVAKAKKIVITSHISPDDDAISSSLSIYKLLVGYYKRDSKNVRVVITGKKPDKWNYFSDYEKIEFVDDLSDQLSETDLLIMLDGSGLSRFSRKDEIRSFMGDTICIDHHPNPEDKHNLHLLCTNYVACAEIIYKLFFEKEKITKELAEVLFLGIWGDTGGLKYVRPDNLSAFDTIKRLVVVGEIDIQTLLSNYQQIDFEIFKIITFLMDKTEIREVPGWPPFQISYVSQKITKGHDFNTISQAYHLYIDEYLRMVTGAEWGFVVVPKFDDKSCNISLRSLPNSVNVRLIAENLNGGGHDRAAGGNIYKTTNPQKAIEQVIEWLKANKPVFK